MHTCEYLTILTIHVTEFHFYQSNILTQYLHYDSSVTLGCW